MPGKREAEMLTEAFSGSASHLGLQLLGEGLNSGEQENAKLLI